MSLFRLLLADDHPVVLTGLRLFFRGDACFEVVGEATSAQAARIDAETLRPDAVITDMVMGDGDGIALIEDLRTILPSARILVYSSRDEAVWAPRAISAGAQGYVAKSEPLDAVAAALNYVMGGSIHVSEAVQQSLMGDLARQRDRRTEIDDMSGRELQVLRLIGRGETLQSLAKQLQLSVKTVGTYRERLKTKLGLDSVRMLERYAADYVAGRIDPS
ncbi:response regulator transcription factor [Brevundimonas sp. G8]|uniref:response regulator transcription factor n=1 Tax=Brevundimonas sp. G8 TaxID=1350776 RepID=UPI00210838D8|nr:response regulator transcription factor [Brevundimonas sp. G8]